MNPGRPRGISPVPFPGVRHSASIIAKFGGIHSTARALGHKNPTTVQGWKERGVIPARQQAAVLAAAAELGIEMGPADFFDIAPAAVTASTEAAA